MIMQNLLFCRHTEVGLCGAHIAAVPMQMARDVSLQMPELPSNAIYIRHTNECFDWGTFGWAIWSNKVDVSQYKYIIFMNSSVRGPFLPPYWPVSLTNTSHDH